jgi:hypothetical protein
MVITNQTDIPLAVAVWAINDSYDYVEDPKYFSVTNLLKPIRQIVLQKRVDPNTLVTDVEEFLARAMGSSIHDSIEKAWTGNHVECLKRLGFKDNVIERFKINPEKDSLKEGDIPIYLEQRTVKEFNGYKIGGKFDFVANGLLHDNKSTSTMKWLKGSSDKDYQMQGSLYRWLNPDIIKEDIIRINYVFTDWKKLDALKIPNYPPHRAMYKDIPLLSQEQTQEWLKNKLDLIEKNMNVAEENLPECTDEELWRDPPKYKYFANPLNTRATKNFDSYEEAYKYMVLEKNNKGCVRTVLSEPRRCNYCSAASICSQRKKMLGEN